MKLSSQGQKTAAGGGGEQQFYPFGMGVAPRLSIVAYLVSDRVPGILTFLLLVLFRCLLPHRAVLPFLLTMSSRNRKQPAQNLLCKGILARS